MIRTLGREGVRQGERKGERGEKERKERKWRKKERKDLVDNKEKIFPCPAQTGYVFSVVYTFSYIIRA